MTEKIQLGILSRQKQTKRSTQPAAGAGRACSQRAAWNRWARQVLWCGYGGKLAQKECRQVDGLRSMHGTLIPEAGWLLLRLVRDAQDFADYELERLDTHIPQAVVRNNDNVLLPKHIAVSSQRLVQVEPRIVLCLFS